MRQASFSLISEAPSGAHQHRGSQYSGEKKWSKSLVSVLQTTQDTMVCKIFNYRMQCVVAESLVRSNKLLPHRVQSSICHQVSVASVQTLWGPGADLVCVFWSHFVLGLRVMLWVQWEEAGRGGEGRPFIVRSIVSIQETPACFQSMRIWMIGTQAEAWISSEHSWDCFPNFVTLIPLRVFTLSTEQVRSGSQAPQGTPLMNSNVQKISKLITFPAPVSDLLKQTQTNKWSICVGGAC